MIGVLDEGTRVSILGREEFWVFVVVLLMMGVVDMI